VVKYIHLPPGAPICCCGAPPPPPPENCEGFDVYTEPQLGGVYIHYLCCEPFGDQYVRIYLDGDLLTTFICSDGGGVYSDIGYEPGGTATYRLKIFAGTIPDPGDPDGPLAADSGDLFVTYGS
jgi:hypothetical protein